MTPDCYPSEKNAFDCGIMEKVQSELESVIDTKWFLRANAHPISNQEDIRAIFASKKVRSPALFTLCLSSIIARSGTHFQDKVQ